MLAKLRELKALHTRKTDLEREAHTRRALMYRLDPVAWVRDRLSEFVWSKQREILAALLRHRRVAVKSCHDVGKSHIASRVAAWWLDVHEPGEAFVVTTAPTYAQVRAVLWRYIRQAHKKAGLPGRVNQTEWLIDEELVAFGRKPADTDAAAFQGIHARRVLVIIDEAGGVPETLWYAADSLTANDGCVIFAIGNPDDPTSHFATVCQPGSGWHTIQISAFDSPNLTGEDVPPELAELLVSKAWVEEKAEEWGEDNPVYIAKVLGDFPTQDPFSVVRISDVQACRLEVDVPYLDTQLLPVELGVDVGGGGDLTVIRERRGPVAGREWTSHSDLPETLAPFVITAIKETGAALVKVDSIGIGWGLVGELRNAGRRGEHSATIVGVNVAESPTDGKKYRKLRDQLWWEVGRGLSAARGWDLSKMDNADTTIAELVSPRYVENTAGQIVVESKDDIRARAHGRSPDHADALLLAFYKPKHTLAGFFDQITGKPA